MARERGPAFGLERLAFFSDAVFAIAITLLAIDLRLPELAVPYTDATLIRALGALMPSIFAFTLSFAVIALFWIGHYRTFRVLDRADSRFVGLNITFLFCVAILPLPTSIVAREGNLSSATVLYAVFGVVAGLLSTLLWVYPTRFAGLVSPVVTPELARHVTYRALVVLIAFAVSIPVALVSPSAAQALWVLTLVGQSLVARRFHLGAALERSLGEFPSPGQDHVAHPGDDRAADDPPGA